jgi:hypothetical protein
VYSNHGTDWMAGELGSTANTTQYIGKGTVFSGFLQLNVFYKVNTWRNYPQN